jgi:ABC-type branched-subunit amino acid transport system substrate-binding protein
MLARRTRFKAQGLRFKALLCASVLGPWSLVLGIFLLLSACIPITRPVVKIGLAAPFEGRYRDTGYAVIYAIRLAVREANQSGIAGYSIELLALDDSGEADMAATQARKMAADPDVVGVVGHWLDDTTLAAALDYAAEAMPLLATTASPTLPSPAFRLWPTESLLQSAIGNQQSAIPGPLSWGQTPFFDAGGGAALFVAPAPMPGDSADDAFADRFRAISRGVEPSAYSVLAYDAARLLFDAIARDVKAHGKPSRAGVSAALLQSDYAGLSGHISFDANRNWAEAKGWVYRYQDGKVVKP